MWSYPTMKYQRVPFFHPRVSLPANHHRHPTKWFHLLNKNNKKKIKKKKYPLTFATVINFSDGEPVQILFTIGIIAPVSHCSCPTIVTLTFFRYLSGFVGSNNPFVDPVQLQKTTLPVISSFSLGNSMGLVWSSNSNGLWTLSIDRS